MRGFPRILPLFVCLLTFSCRDVIFNNPLDPNASRPEVFVIKTMEVEVKGEGGLAFDGEKLWKGIESGQTYALETEAGQILKSFSLPPGLKGLAFYEGKFYISYPQERTIRVVDALSGVVIDRIIMKTASPGYLAVFEGKIVFFDESTGSFMEYDFGEKEVRKLFSAQGFEVAGVDCYQGKIMVAERASLVLYLFETDGRIFASYSLPTASPSGITVDESDFIYIFSKDGKIYKASLQ